MPMFALDQLGIGTTSWGNKVKPCNISYPKTITLIADFAKFI